MFPDIDEQPTDAGASHERFFIIPTCQKSQYDLIQIGVEIENEKDRLLLTVSLFQSLPGITSAIYMKILHFALFCSLLNLPANLLRNAVS
jgi:hypothetical protein